MPHPGRAPKRQSLRRWALACAVVLLAAACGSDDSASRLDEESVTGAVSDLPVATTLPSVTVTAPQVTAPTEVTSDTTQDTVPSTQPTVQDTTSTTTTTTPTGQPAKFTVSETQTQNILGRNLTATTTVNGFTCDGVNWDSTFETSGDATSSGSFSWVMSQGQTTAIRAESNVQAGGATLKSVLTADVSWVGDTITMVGKATDASGLVTTQQLNLSAPVQSHSC